MLLSFDEDGARILGVKARAINYVFSILVAATIVVASSRLEGWILHIRRLFPSLRRPRR